MIKISIGTVIGTVIDRAKRTATERDAIEKIVTTTTTNIDRVTRIVSEDAAVIVKPKKTTVIMKMTGTAPHAAVAKIANDVIEVATGITTTSPSLPPRLEQFHRHPMHLQARRQIIFLSVVLVNPRCLLLPDLAVSNLQRDHLRIATGTIAKVAPVPFAPHPPPQLSKIIMQPSARKTLASESVSSNRVVEKTPNRCQPALAHHLTIIRGQQRQPRRR